MSDTIPFNATLNFVTLRAATSRPYSGCGANHQIAICKDAIVGAATSRPQRNGTARLVEWHAIRTHCRGGSQPPAFVPGQKCSVEWYHVRHSTNSPKLIRDCRFVPRGRLRASPTVLSWCCGNSPNPVHHFWLVLRGRLVAAPTVAWSNLYPPNYNFSIGGLTAHMTNI